jgi:hypothetical protein
VQAHYRGRTFDVASRWRERSLPRLQPIANGTLHYRRCCAPFREKTAEKTKRMDLDNTLAEGMPPYLPFLEVLGQYIRTALKQEKQGNAYAISSPRQDSSIYASRLQLCHRCDRSASRH